MNEGMTALDAFTARDLQVALQVNQLMAQHGISADDLREMLKANFSGTHAAKGKGKRKTGPDEPASFHGSGFWPPPARSGARKAWLSKLSEAQRREYKAWRKRSLEKETYGRRRP